MRINKLAIKAFRGIDDLTLEFPETQTTVLIGDNGSGKTAILECIASFLSLIIQRMGLAEEHQGFEITKEDIKSGNSSTTNVLEFTIHDRIFLLRYELGQHGVVRLIHDEWWQTAFDFPTTYLPKGAIPAILVYYSVHRTLLNVSLEAKKQHTFDHYLAFDHALTQSSIDFQRFFEWFRMREDYENEIRLDQEVSYRDKELETVRTAMHQMLPGFSNPRIRRNPLQMLVVKGKEELQIKQLSDGEKGLITMVGDIARRLANVNPDLDNPLQGKGIVLIDEIEAHLHPKRQRAVIPNLEKIFPNCQFIVTTYSPQVLSLVKPESIFVLVQTKEGIKAFHPRISYGRDSNQILEEVMDVPERPQEIQDQLNTYFRMIADGETEQAEVLREELETKIGKDDPKFVRADGILRRKEHIGR